MFEHAREGLSRELCSLVGSERMLDVVFLTVRSAFSILLPSPSHEIVVRLRGFELRITKSSFTAIADGAALSELTR